MVKTTPLPFFNTSPQLYCAYAHLYTTIPGSLIQNDDKTNPTSTSTTVKSENTSQAAENSIHENSTSPQNATTAEGASQQQQNGIAKNAPKQDSNDPNTQPLTPRPPKFQPPSYTTTKKSSKPTNWPKIFLFGSLAMSEENTLCVEAGNCYRFNWVMGDWQKLNVPLEARYQFASCQFGNKVLLHGGYDNYTKEKLSSSIQIFDMETNQLDTIETDLSLACHAGCYHPISHSFIVFGGRSKVNGRCTTTKSLMKFSLSTHKWEDIPIQENAPHPPERYGHSLVSYGDNIVVLFGGKNHQDELLNDLWFFDLSTGKWEHISDTVGDVPSGRQFHCALRHHHTMYILGGEEPEGSDDNHPLYALDLKTRHWDAFRLTGRLNTRRIGISMALFSNNLIGESIVTFGGMIHTKRHFINGEAVQNGHEHAALSRQSSSNKNTTHNSVTVPLSNEMFHITSISQYKLKRKLEALGDSVSTRPKKRQKVTPRKLVAALVDEEWILARIVKALEKGFYELEDAQAMTEDAEEKTTDEPPKTYVVHGSKIARLSASLKDHTPLPRGTKVLALYPGTSCLYPGIIEDHGDESYYVLFEDDEEDGETPLREIGFKLLCPYQEGDDSSANGEDSGSDEKQQARENE